MVPVAYRSPILIDAFFARPTALCAPQRVEHSDQIECMEATCGPCRRKGLVMVTQGDGDRPAATSRRKTLGKKYRTTKFELRPSCGGRQWKNRKGVGRRFLFCDAPYLTGLALGCGEHACEVATRRAPRHRIGQRGDGGLLERRAAVCEGARLSAGEHLVQARPAAEERLVRREVVQCAAEGLGCGLEQGAGHGTLLEGGQPEEAEEVRLGGAGGCVSKWVGGRVLSSGDGGAGE